jgi:copper chaperone CopZ
MQTCDEPLLLCCRNARQTVAALALAIALSGTPELVRLYNEEGLARLLHGAKSGSPSLAAASPGKDSSPVADSASLETWETVRMRVEGLRCAACAMRLKHALAAEVAGVAAAEVEFESGAVAVHGRGVSKKGLIACAAQLGYSARVLAFQDEPPGGATAQEL